MGNSKGRPKVYGGSAVGVRLLALMGIKIRAPPASPNTGVTSGFPGELGKAPVPACEAPA